MRKHFRNFFRANLCQAYYLIYTAYISANIEFLAFVGSSRIDGLKLKYPKIHPIFECQFHPIKIIVHSIFLASHTHIHANMSFIEKKMSKINFFDTDIEGRTILKLRIFLDKRRFSKNLNHDGFQKHFQIFFA